MGCLTKLINRIKTKLLVLWSRKCRSHISSVKLHGVDFFASFNVKDKSRLSTKRGSKKFDMKGEWWQV